MRKYIIVVIVLSVVFIFTSCTTPTTSPEPSIGVNIPLDKLNTWVKLEDPPELTNSHKNDDLLQLHLINLSEKMIVFPGDFGIKVIRLDGQERGDISNNFFNGSEPHYLPPRSSYPLGLIVGTLPFVSGLSATIKIRIIVVGHVENLDGQQVGAYIDVELNP